MLDPAAGVVELSVPLKGRRLFATPHKGPVRLAEHPRQTVQLLFGLLERYFPSDESETRKTG